MSELVELGLNFRTELMAIQGEEVNHVWEEVRDLIQAALDKSPEGVLAEEVRQNVIRGEEVLWMAARGRHVVAVCTTFIYDTGEEKVFQIRVVAGEDLRGWLHHYGELEEWARDNECTIIRCIGRPGWKYILKDMGMESYAVVYAKRLED